MTPSGRDAWFLRLAQGNPRILVVQRDNIGDLVLVTPFLKALRTCLPDARVDVLVNSYNAAVLEGHPDVERRFAYQKAKHRAAGTSVLSVYLDTLRLWRQLRAQHYDLAVLMTGRFSAASLRPALAARAAHIAGFVESGRSDPRVDLPVDAERIAARHVVDRSAALLDAILPAPLRSRWTGALPPCHIVPQALAVGMAQTEIDIALAGHQGPLVGIHLSARKVDQRWPAERFAELMHRCHSAVGARFILFWSPGSADNPRHPGDDAKAEEVLALTTQLPVLAYPTERLEALIGALALPALVVCSDGGAMHLAAAQGRPTVALFGNSDPEVWHPWGNRHVVLRPPSQRVADLGVEEVVEASLQLLSEARV